jgi:hypothetical protein
MSAPVTDLPSGDRLERLEAAFLRSPDATWPLPPPAEPAPVDVPRSWVPDDDEDESEPGMTLIRTNRYCCR